MLMQNQIFFFFKRLLISMKILNKNTFVLSTKYVVIYFIFDTFLFLSSLYTFVYLKHSLSSPFASRLINECFENGIKSIEI